MEYLFVLGRILLGGYFIMSGINHFKHTSMLAHYAKSKGVPMPKEAVMLSGLMMVLGGLGVVLGVYVEFAVFLLSAFLVVTTLQMHPYWKETDQMAKMGEEVNFKKNLALLGAVLMILAIPLPWTLSLIL